MYLAVKDRPDDLNPRYPRRPSVTRLCSLVSLTPLTLETAIPIR
jgi:hypothetical protein